MKTRQARRNPLFRTFAICHWTFAFCLAFPSRATSPDGERLYLANCAPCHGQRGEGGAGTTLARQRLLRGSDDENLFRIIRRGIPGTAMPGTRHLTDGDIRALIPHLRSLGRTAATTASGDPARGEQLYRSKGDCSRCHMIRGHGGALGPDLTGIGARRGAAHLRASILDPEAAIPENFLVYRLFSVVPDSFLQVRVVTRDGRRITGSRINEDSFSIQLRDYSDRLHSFWKSELAELDRQWGKSPMPSYRAALTAAEVDDVVAYLVSLRGGQ